MVDTIIKKFSSEDVRKRFLKICKRLEHQFRQDSNKHKEIKYKNELWESVLRNYFSKSDLVDSVDELAYSIINELPKPSRMAVIDISDGFLTELAETIPSDFSKVEDYFNCIYEAFLSTINEDISTSYRSSPILFFRTSQSRNDSHASNKPLEVIKDCIWRNEDDTNISIVKRGQFECCAVLSGRISEFAFDDLPRDIQFVLSCAVRSIVLLEPEAFIDTDSSRYSTLSRIPIASLDTILINQTTITDYLNSYFPSRLEEKGSFDKRMYNAVHLLAASDELTNNAAGLALSMSALEALLCDGKELITKQLASRVSFLLEPTTENSIANHNKTKFYKGVEKLYDSRSKVLHGKKTTVKESERLQSRHLVAEVIETLSCMKRLGYLPQNSKDYSDWLSALKDERPVLPIERNSVWDYWQ